MRLRFWIAGLIACLLFGAVVAGCGGGGSSSSESSSSESEPAESTTASETEGEEEAESGSGGGEVSLNVKPRTIGLVATAENGDEIGEANTETIEAAAEDLGWTIEKVDAEGDPAVMLRATEAFATKGVDAVIFDSTQPEWVLPGLRRLKSLGIPAIEYSAGVPESPFFDAEYSEDEKRVGVEMGKVLVEQVPNAKIGEIQSSFEAGTLRREGLEEVVNGPEGNGAEIVAGVEPNLVNVVPETTKGVTDLLTAHPEINVIFSVYDNYLQPTISALRSKGSKAKIVDPYLVHLNFEELQNESSPLVGVANVDNPTTAALAISELIAFFEEGKEINREALKEHPLTYQTYTRENLPASWEEVLGPEHILPSFLKEWEEKYGK